MGSRLNRFRFLPLTIGAAALLLVLKLGAIWSGVDGWLDGSIAIRDARAEQVPAESRQSAVPEVPQATAAPEAEGAGDPMTDDVVKGLTEDPTLLTVTEIDLLQKLAERREALDDRAREMEVQEGLLAAAERRIDQKVEELKTLQGTIETLIETYDDQQQAKVASLVKIYENMKPKDAARIFEELDIDTLLLVAERMKERKLAPIMAQMNPARAKEVTVELARLRQLPEDTAASAGL